MKIPFINRDKEQAPEEEQSFVVMSSGDLIPKNEFRSHVETQMQRAISSGTSADSGLLAGAVALSVPAMVCINYHSNVMSSIPIVVNDGQNNKADFVPMKHMVESRMRWLIHNIDKSLLIWGYALIRKRYNADGFPTMLEFLHPLNVRINTDSKQNIINYQLQREQEELSLNEVIYIAVFDLGDSGNPTSKLENAFAYLGLERGIVTHATSFFFNGASIAGVVSIEGMGLTDEKFKDFKKIFARQFKGANNAFKVAIFDRNVTYTPLSAAPADLAMGELSDQAKQFVCSAFGVNPALVGLGDVSDDLSASSTFDATKRNFIDMEATPSLDFILDNLNTQWALTDFAMPLVLVSDSSAMAMMNDGISSEDMGVATSAVSGNVWDVIEARNHVGYEPFDADDIFILRDPAWASGLYNDGTISLNMKRKILGIEPPLIEDMIKVDGITYRTSDRVLVAENNLKKSEAPPPPSPFGGLSAPPAPAMLSDGVIRSPLGLVETQAELQGATVNRLFPATNIVMVEGIARTITPRLIIGIDLADHQLVNLARRELGRALENESGITWVSPDNWRVEIAHIDRWSPADIANMTRVIKWDFNKTEVLTGDYFINGNAVYLSLGDTKATEEMSRLVHNDLRSVSIKTNEATPAMAIRLCHGDISPELIPAETALGSMPIVFTRIAAFANDKIQHKWRLRAYLDKDDQTQLGKQRDELSKWSMKIARSGLASEWDIEYLPAHVVRFVRGDEGKHGNMKMTEIFDTARRMLAVRALQALRLDWENFVEALIADTRAGNVKDRTRFGVILRGEMERFAGRAYLDGLVDGGVLDATLSDSDETKIKTMLANNSAFVSGLSETLFKGDGISDAQAAGKPRQWWAGAVLPFYQEGFTSAGANPMMEFVGAFGADPCVTCRHLFGQRHRLNVWNKNGLGMVGGSFVGQRTICGEGGHCKHSIVTVVARASGSIRSEDETINKRLDEIKAQTDESVRSIEDIEELRLALKKKFEEEDVNRDPDGKFGSGTGGDSDNKDKEDKDKEDTSDGEGDTESDDDTELTLKEKIAKIQEEDAAKEASEKPSGPLPGQVPDDLPGKDPLTGQTSSAGSDFIARDDVRNQSKPTLSAKNLNDDLKWQQGTTPDESLALDSWSGDNWDDFQSIVDGGSFENTNITQEEFDDFENAIDKAPAYEGVSWRGMGTRGGDTNTVLADFKNQIGGNIEFDNYSSASGASTVASGFLGNKSAPTLFEIHSNQGHYINSQSAYGGSGATAEYEVVFEPDSEFTIRDAYIGKSKTTSGQLVESIIVVLED